jgi:nucleotide-binding universal stress UspA family protein
MNKLQATFGDQSSDKSKTNVARSSGHFVSLDDNQKEVPIERFLGRVHHILVPINLIQDSLRTIRYAIRLGQHCDSRLTLLHVYQLPVAFGISSGTDRNTELLQDRHEAEETLKAQGTLVRAAYPNCEWIMHSGDPGKGILEVALKLGADLIVISSHHHHWYDRYRPTNIADYILCHATCAILEVSDSGESFLNCLNSAGRVKFHEWGVATK